MRHDRRSPLPLLPLLVALAVAPSAGCMSLPEHVRTRPTHTTFDPAGTWYAVARSSDKGVDEEFVVEVTAGPRQWYSLTKRGDKRPFAFGLTDGDRFYLVGGDTQHLHVMAETDHGFESVWGRPASPLGYEVADSTRPYVRGRYTANGFVVHGIDGEGRTRRDALNIYGARGQDARYHVIWNSTYEARVGIGWRVGEKLIAVVVPAQSYRYWTSYGPSTQTRTTETTYKVVDYALTTLEREGDRLVGVGVRGKTEEQPKEIATRYVFGRQKVSTRDFLDVQCGRGVAQDCVRLGLSLLGAKGGAAADPERAAAALRRACDLKSKVGCYQFGRTEHARGSPEGQAYLERACLDGHAVACARVADIVAPADPRTAAALREKACGMGSLWACHALALSIQKTQPDVAEAYFKKACQPGLRKEIAAKLCDRGAPAAAESQGDEE